MSGEAQALVGRIADAALADLLAFLRIPSVSAERRGAGEACGFLVGLIEKLGGQARKVESGGLPAVLGQFGPEGGAERSLLVYGHYDVQPADPYELWQTDPFDPVVRDGKIVARGATDDKGNIVAALWGVWVARALRLPLPHVKVCFEGEEEIGSPNLHSVLAAHPGEVRADACVLFDRGIHESGVGQIYLGNKGLLSVELETELASRDVHSSQAGCVPNAARRLMQVVIGLASADGEVAVREVREMARRPSADELALMERIPFNVERYAEGYGLRVDELNGSGDLGDKVGVLTRLLFEPTANVQGFHSGYGGPGTKTVIPSRAGCKLDIRLAPGMAKERAAALVEEVVLRLTREAGIGDRTRVRISADLDPYTAPAAHPVVRAAIEAAGEIYGASPVVWPLVDGSGPLATFAAVSGGPAFIVGLGNPFERAATHAPNENLDVEVFRKGIAMAARFFQLSARVEGCSELG